MMPDPSVPTLQVQDLHKAFTLHLRGGLRLPVLRGVSLSVGPGECVALVGPSGQGKSTLMKCLYGSYAADAGRMWLADARQRRIDLAQATAQEMIALRRGDISYVTQFLRALPRVSALDVVAHRLLEGAASESAQPDPLDDAAFDEQLEIAREQVRHLFETLNLPRGLWQLPPATFSGGEQQRVNIARGFIRPSRLLLLDEPTASLDTANARIVVDLIRQAKQAGSAVVGIFHDEPVRDAVADRCVSLA